MTTEVQIKKCQSHLTYLSMVVSKIASGLGMSRRDMEETASAVSEVCRRSIDESQSNEGSNLSVKVKACGTHITVEITDPRLLGDTVCAEDISGQGYHTGILERIGHLVDRVELVRDGDATTVVIMKHVGRLETTESKSFHYAAAMGAAASLRS